MTERIMKEYFDTDQEMKTRCMRHGKGLKS